MEVITNLVEETIRSMREVGLVESYIKTLGHTWNAFDRWLAEKGLSYDPSLGWTFLSEEYGIEGPGGRSKTRAEQIRRRAVTALESFHEHRPWRRVKDRQYFPRFRESHRPVLERFLESMEGRLSDSTVCGYVHMLNRLSPCLADRGIDDIAHIDQAAIVGFMGSIADSGVGQGLVYATACRLRRLLAWLELSGFVRQGCRGFGHRVEGQRPQRLHRPAPHGRHPQRAGLPAPALLGYADAPERSRPAPLLRERRRGLKPGPRGRPQHAVHAGGSSSPCWP